MRLHIRQSTRFVLITVSVCLFVVFSSIIAAAGSAISKKRLLVVTVTKGFRHESIPTAERVLEEFGARYKFTIDFARTDDELRVKTAPAKLKSYDGIVFANTTGDLPLADRAAFLNFVSTGGAFIGIHSASDTFRGKVFPEYIAMLGGEFEGHGLQRSVNLRIDDSSHPATRHMPDAASNVRPRVGHERPAMFTVYDEIYRITNFDRSRVRLLLSLDHHPDTNAPGLYPLAWCRAYGKGRVFYTALGHRDDVLRAEWFRRHLAGGIEWAVKARNLGRD